MLKCPGLMPCVSYLSPVRSHCKGGASESRRPTVASNSHGANKLRSLCCHRGSAWEPPHKSPRRSKVEQPCLPARERFQSISAYAYSRPAAQPGTRAATKRSSVAPARAHFWGGMKTFSTTQGSSITAGGDCTIVELSVHCSRLKPPGPQGRSCAPYPIHRDRLTATDATYSKETCSKC